MVYTMKGPRETAESDEIASDTTVTFDEFASDAGITQPPSKRFPGMSRLFEMKRSRKRTGRKYSSSARDEKSMRHAREKSSMKRDATSKRTGLYNEKRSQSRSHGSRDRSTSRREGPPRFLDEDRSDRTSQLPMHQRSESRGAKRIASTTNRRRRQAKSRERRRARSSREWDEYSLRANTTNESDAESLTDFWSCGLMQLCFPNDEYNETHDCKSSQYEHNEIHDGTKLYDEHKETHDDQKETRDDNKETHDEHEESHNDTKSYDHKETHDENNTKFFDEHNETRDDTLEYAVCCRLSELYQRIIGNDNDTVKDVTPDLPTRELKEETTRESEHESPAQEVRTRKPATIEECWKAAEEQYILKRQVKLYSKMRM